MDNERQKLPVTDFNVYIRGEAKDLYWTAVLKNYLELYTSSMIYWKPARIAWSVEFIHSNDDIIHLKEKLSISKVYFKQ